MLGTAQLKTAIVRRLRAQFRTAAVPYIPSTWNTIIQSKPVDNTPYPYICVEIDNNDIKEVAVTSQGSSYDYFVGIKIVTRSEINADTRESRDAMVSEVQRILDVNYDEYLNLESKGFTNVIYSGITTFRMANYVHKIIHHVHRYRFLFHNHWYELEYKYHRLFFRG